MALMKDHGFSGIPVVTGAAKGLPGKLFGILTNRDCALRPTRARRSPN